MLAAGLDAPGVSEQLHAEALRAAGLLAVVRAVDTTDRCASLLTIIRALACSQGRAGSWARQGLVMYSHLRDGSARPACVRSVVLASDRVLAVLCSDTNSGAASEVMRIHQTLQVSAHQSCSVCL